MEHTKTTTTTDCNNNIDDHEDDHEDDEEEFDYKMKLQQHHLDIVQCLDLDRHFILSHLRSKLILDDEDCQIIRSPTSRQQQATKFIDVLITKGPNGFIHFIEALEIEYPHLYETITGNEAANPVSYTHLTLPTICSV